MATFDGWPEVFVEIAPGYSPLDASPVWEDITDRVEPDLDVQRGATREWEQASAGTFRFRCQNDDRRFDPTNTESGYQTSRLDLTGASTSYVSTPDAAALDVTGDLDLRIKVELSTWGGVDQTLAAKWAGASDRSWIWRITSDGYLQLDSSQNGLTDFVEGISTEPLNVGSGIRWLRSTADFSGVNDVVRTHYISTDDTDDHTAVNWVLLGDALPSFSTGIYNSTTPVTIGMYDGGTDPLTGKVYAFAMLSGIDGTAVADPLFTDEAAGTTSFADDAGRTWTLNGPASIEVDTDALSLIRPRMPVRFRASLSSVALDLGGAGSSASTPDAAALDITGDLDLRVRVAMDAWVPAVNQALIGKWVATGNQRSYLLGVATTGALFLSYTPDGVTQSGPQSTADPVVADGDFLWVRATIDVDNGAGGRTITYYTSNDATFDHSEVVWEQLGDPVVTATAITLFSSTAPLQVGAYDSPVDGMVEGRITAAAVLDGINGTVVADPRFDLQTPAASSFADDAGRTWTINSPAAIVDAATDYDLFRGYGSAIEQEYSELDAHMAVFECVDLFGVLASIETTAETAWDLKVRQLGPKAWWPMNGLSAENTVGASRIVPDVAGIYPGTFSRDDPLVDNVADSLIDGDDGTSAGPNIRIILPKYTFTGVTAPWSLSVWFATPTATGTHTVFSLNTLAGWTLLTVTSAGLCRIKAAAGATITTVGRVDDELPHNATISVSSTGVGSFYVDGELIGTSAAGAYTHPGPVKAFGVGGWGTSVTNDRFIGSIDDVVMFARELTPTEAVDLYDAGHDSWSGDTTGGRIQRILDATGLPAGLVDLDVGLSTVGRWEPASTVLDLAQDVNATEQGWLYANGSGVLVFRDRHFSLNRPITAALSDLTAAGYVSHDNEYSESQIINRVTLSSEAGAVTVEDANSIRRYGIHSEQRSTLDDSLANLQGAANNILGRSSQPYQRIIQLTIDPDLSQSHLWPIVLGVEIGDRISFVRNPTQGSPITTDLVVLGVGHQVRLSNRTTPWRTRLMVAASEPQEVFEIDSDTYGQIDGPYPIAAF